MKTLKLAILADRGLDETKSIVYHVSMSFPFLAACTLTSMALSASAANLLENGSFEQPEVAGRKPSTGGGNPAVGADPTSFVSLTAKAAEGAGGLQVGITNEIARTGKQSLYVDFQKVTAAGVRASLTTKPIAVKPEQAYKVALWCRIDRKRPLALDESRPEMWIEVRFLREDRTTEVGEPVAGAQLIPGDVVPGGPHPLRFSSEKWKESSAELETPPNAGFMTISWYWITTEEEGGTDGGMFLDDASLEESVATPAEDAANPKAAESPASVQPAKLPG